HGGLHFANDRLRAGLRAAIDGPGRRRRLRATLGGGRDDHRGQRDGRHEQPGDSDGERAHVPFPFLLDSRGAAPTGTPAVPPTAPEKTREAGGSLSELPASLRIEGEGGFEVIGIGK